MSLNRSDTDGGEEKIALVLTGGGARAAYQVGCLRCIAREFPHFEPKILTGVSAGAINAAFLASHTGTWIDSLDELRSVWLDLKTEKVYRTDSYDVLWRVLRMGLRILSGGRLGSGTVRGMVDTAPLANFLFEHLETDADGKLKLDAKLRKGVLEAIALVTTNYANGRAEAWVQSSSQNLWEKGQLTSRPTELMLSHVLASAAIPLFFPAVRLGGSWHGDGHLRLNAPLSPAIHLGATKILAVSPSFKVGASNSNDQSTSQEYPSPKKIAGVCLNSIFLDLLDYDVLQMQRINQMLEKLPESEWGAFRRVDVMALRPKIDLGELAQKHEEKLPKSFDFFQSGWGDSDEKTSDLLSMVIFEPDYLEEIIRRGEEDTEERVVELEAFFAPK